MLEAARLRFTLADAMFLVAATAPGLVLLRIAAGLQLFKPDLSGKVPFGRELVEYLSLAGGCILISLMTAVLVLSGPYSQLTVGLRWHLV